MPKAVFVDPRLDWQFGPNPLIEQCVSQLRAFRCQISDGRADVLNSVDWGRFLMPRIWIRLGAQEPAATESPVPTNTVKTETGVSNPLNWRPVLAPERLRVDESGVRLTEGIRVRVVEDLECATLGAARILVLAVTDTGSQEIHCVLALDSDLFDDAGQWRDALLRDRYERFLSGVTGLASAAARVDLTGHQESEPSHNVGMSPALRVALDLERQGRSKRQTGK